MFGLEKEVRVDISFHQVLKDLPGGEGQVLIAAMSRTRKCLDPDFRDIRTN